MKNNRAFFLAIVSFCMLFSLIFTKISVHLEHISRDVKVILIKLK
jgi:hypothetical protein